jgi:hypothetical protein
MAQLKRTRTGTWASPLAFLSAVLTGLLAGAMFFIDVVLLPFWRTSSPDDFRRWFTAHAPRIRSVMVPLGLGAGVVSATSAAIHMAGHDGNSRASVAAAATTWSVVAITVAVNEPANARFTGGQLTDDETRDLLRRWAQWHHARVVLGLLATAAAVAALQGARK